MDLNRWVVIIGIVVAYFVISMFMDEIPLLLLTLQLTFPLITSLGFDPIWFGVLSMLMVAMGLVFPPVGLLAFVVSATAGVDLMKVYKGTSILMLSIVRHHRAGDGVPADRAVAAGDDALSADWKTRQRSAATARDATARPSTACALIPASEPNAPAARRALAMIAASYSSELRIRAGERQARRSATFGFER